jgi:uncharacterized lipoprotein YmbA
LPACLLLCLLLASACGSLLPRSPSSSFYVLTAAEPPAAARPPAAPSVLLGPVVLPEYLDRRELVTRLASNQLRVEDLDLWAEPLRESVPRTIERDLTTALGEGTVQRSPWTGAAPPETAVSVEIRRFEKTSSGTVQLTATWTIREGSAGLVRLRRVTSLSFPSSGSTQAAVEGMSDALAALSREIAGGLRESARPAVGARDRP